MKKISFSQNQKNIMLKKIEFLENQLQDITKKKEKLEQSNEQLKKQLTELSKTNIDMSERSISQNINELELELEWKGKQREIMVETIKNGFGHSDEYKRQMNRMRRNMDQYIESIELAHARERKHFEKKIECLEINLRKSQNYEMTDLKNQNSQLKKRLNQRNQMNASQLQLQSVIKALDKRDTTLILDDIQNVSFNRIPTQTDYSSSKPRLTMTRSQSGISQRKVISSLFCELCQQSYPPNQYYKHLSLHGEKGRLIIQKLEIEKKIKEKGQRKKLEQQLNTIVVALKDHQKRQYASARTLIR